MKFTLHLVGFIAILVFPLKSEATFLPFDAYEKDVPKMGSSDMTEKEFREIIRNMHNAFAPVVKKHGGNLSIAGDWKSEKLNAGAQQLMGTWRVLISGALARRPELTADGFTLILCHELGHHLAGFSLSPPAMPLDGIWSANEGQSDYFAAHACARMVWSEEREKNRQSRELVSPYVKERCDAAFGDEDSQNLCYRTNLGNESVIATMAAIMKKEMPRFETPNPTVVEKTVNSHPEIQCRLDSSFQGSLCSVDFNFNMIPGKNVKGGQFGKQAEMEAAQSSCTTIYKHVVGNRPACWFRSNF
jgi:hypothetical protein